MKWISEPVVVFVGFDWPFDLPREFLHFSVNYLVIVGMAISMSTWGAVRLAVRGVGLLVGLQGLRGVMGPSVLSSEPILCYNLNFGQEVEQLLRILYRDVWEGSPAPENSHRIPEIIPCLDRTAEHKQKIGR